MRLPSKAVLVLLCLLPRAGMSMDQVRARFGEPQTVVPAVGKPPITRWVYPDFTVYFEYDKVIHAVVNRPTR